MELVGTGLKTNMFFYLFFFPVAELYHCSAKEAMSSSCPGQHLFCSSKKRSAENTGAWRQLCSDTIPLVKGSVMHQQIYQLHMW